MALIRAQRAGITEAKLIGPARDVWLFARSYHGTYQELPSPDVVAGKLGIQLDAPEAPSVFLADEVMTRGLQGSLQTMTMGLSNLLAQAKPKEALELLQKHYAEIQASVPRDALFTIGDLATEVESNYDLMKGGMRGMPTPWPTLDEATLGIWPEDLVVVVARQGVGKTYTLLLMAMAAWNKGHRVLFLSPETSRVAIARRFIAMDLKLTYGALRRGGLDPVTEAAFRERVKLLQTAEGFEIMGGRFALNPSSVEATVMERKPDFIAVDAPYTLAMGGKDRMDNAAKAFTFLKTLVIGTPMACATNMQFNRQGAKEVDIVNVGLTDMAGWNADVLMAIYATPDEIRDKRMWIKLMKNRDGDLPPPFQANWNFANMDFSELATAPANYDPGVDQLPPLPDIPTALGPTTQPDNIPF